MINRCPSCGGFLRYEIASGTLVCESCGTQLRPEEYRDGTEAEEIREGVLETTIFTCPSCGGEVTAGTLDAVGYCSFCGGEVTLESRMAKIRRPDKIVPFTVTEENCKEAYKNAVRKAPFVSGELKDEQYLSRFRSIYVPYWSYEVEYGPHAKLDSFEETRRGNYIYKKHYDLDVDYEARVREMFDASSSLDDSISREMTSAGTSDRLRPFHSSYLFGVYTDTADLNSDLYRQDAVWEANNDLEKQMKGDGYLLAGREMVLPKQGRSEAYGRLPVREPELVMLPVWFLTWRKKDKVAYSMVNGVTNEVCAELPQSFPRFLAGSALIAIPIFLLLNLFLTMMPAVILLVSAVLSVFVLRSYQKQLDKIHARMTHVDDKGYLAARNLSVEETDKRRNKAGISAKYLGKNRIRAGEMIIIWIMVIYAAVVLTTTGDGGLYDLLENRAFQAGIFVMADILCILSLRKILKKEYQEAVPLSERLLDTGGVILAVLCAQIIVFLKPPQDWIYWAAVIFSLLGIILTISGLVRKYNLLVTRPVPHFFDRGGETGS